MVDGLCSDNLIAAWNCRPTAGVRIRWRALALFAAIRRFLIELADGEAVERPHKQKNCE